MDQKGLDAMLVIKNLVGVAPEVNLRDPLHTGNETCKQEFHPGFETHGTHHHKSKSQQVENTIGLLTITPCLKRSTIHQNPGANSGPYLNGVTPP